MLELLFYTSDFYICVFVIFSLVLSSGGAQLGKGDVTALAIFGSNFDDSFG